MSLSYPAVLATEAKIICSDALMYSSHSFDDISNISAVKVTEKTVRGTISNASDAGKHDKSSANIQTVDYAQLSSDDDTLVVKYTVKFLPFDGTCCACNDLEFQNKLLDIVKTYREKHSLFELSSRYAQNIANARSIFRNKLSADKIVTIVNYKDRTFTFDSGDISENIFGEYSNNADLKELADIIKSGFDGQEFVLLDVTVKALIGKNQAVYPSQEMILSSTDKKSKVLFSINSQAAIHSQKIGNGIRTIDDFYQLNSKGDIIFNRPISVEPYGAVTNYGLVLRDSSTKIDFYTLFKNLMCKDKELSLEEMHFVIAVLIRGGVFGEAKKK